MILARKNVYKDVNLLKMFSSFVRCFESVSVCLENSKDVFFEIKKVIRSILPTQKSFSFVSFSFDIVILPLIW